MAIRIRAKKAPAKHDLGASKFFGTPTVPKEWMSCFEENELFLCQVKLADIAMLDTENILPHSGYLYIFLTPLGEGYPFATTVRYYDGEPTVAIDDFNSMVEGFEYLTEDHLMEFDPVDDNEDCTRLFGEISGWSDENAPLLLQFDPLDSEMGFLSQIDGYLYIFLGEDGSLDGARAVVESS